MRNIMKVLLILVVCLGLLSGCLFANNGGSTGETGGTTVPQETTGETPEETTTEKPVNIVEDPLNNGEGDPLDAIDSTSDETGPVIDIEIDDDGGNTTTPTQGGSTGGNSEDNVTEPTTGGDDEDDLVVDFDDLVNGGK